jgi:NAD(P)-dependent dehydrogenase (short-subunit alcohol dehydrogenase family)
VSLHQVHGIRCDMSDPADVAALGQYSREKLGVVHTFINNAGEVTSKRLLADVDPHELVRVVGESYHCPHSSSSHSPIAPYGPMICLTASMWSFSSS